MGFQLLVLNNPHEDLIKEVTEVIELSKITNKIHVMSFSCSTFMNIILMYKGGYKVLHFNYKTPEYLSIDNVNYYFTPHFIERYITRFNIIKCKKYTLLEMLAKEILFIHNSINKLDSFNESRRINSRYGKSVVSKRTSRHYVCVTYLLFGKDKSKYKKLSPDPNWFEKYN